MSVMWPKSEAVVTYYDVVTTYRDYRTGRRDQQHREAGKGGIWQEPFVFIVVLSDGRRLPMAEELEGGVGEAQNHFSMRHLFPV